MNIAQKLAQYQRDKKLLQERYEGIKAEAEEMFYDKSLPELVSWREKTTKTINSTTEVEIISKLVMELGDLSFFKLDLPKFLRLEEKEGRLKATGEGLDWLGIKIKLETKTSGYPLLNK